VHRGLVVAEWGDPGAVEMSFSVTKTYLSLLAGVAFDRGLFGDVHEPVSTTVNHPAFRGATHSAITWHHLLHQTSEWGGELWTVPWWGDPQGGQAAGDRLRPPGMAWAYNDVRVNLLALALLHLFRQPLPEVLASEVMDPIGGTSGWEWHGYRTSDVELDGRRMRSVSGGGHWGGGLWASAYDHARVGVLYLCAGRWLDHQVLSEQWVRMSWTPCPLKEDYGYLWWLNHGKTVLPRAPATGRCARGNGGRQLIWVDPPRDLVVVSRWTEHIEDLLVDVSAAIPAQPADG
jgi:CubicO group peptidase (beta-lactamase class C family)